MAERIILTTTLLILFFGLRRLTDGKISARLQYALWIFVAARLLFAWLPMPGSEISVLRLYELSQERIAENQAKAMPEAAEEKQKGSDKESAEDREEAVVLQDGEAAEWQEEKSGSRLPGSEGQREGKENMAPARSFFETGQLVQLLYGLGIGVVFFLIVFQNLRFYRMLRKRRILYEGDLPYREIPGKVYLLENISSPFLFGRQIYIAPEMLEDGKKLYHILVHETCHWRQGDMLWAVVKNICCMLYWYHPLLWISVRLSEIDGELACDECALRVLGQDRSLEYGETLLSLLKGQKKENHSICFSTQMSGRKHIVEKRVRRIARQASSSRKNFWAAGASVLTLAGIALCVSVTLPGSVQPPATVAVSDGDTQEGAEGAEGTEWSETETAGYPVLLTDERGNITGSIRGNLFTKIYLDYTFAEDGTEFLPFEIKSGAFSACKNLKTLIIPQQVHMLSYVKYIAEDAFEGCSKDLVVYCEKESYVYKRLKELGIQTKEYTDEDDWLLLGGHPEKLRQLSKRVNRIPTADFSMEELRMLYGEPFFIMTQSGLLPQSQCESLLQIYEKEMRFPREASATSATFCQRLFPANITIIKEITEIGPSTFLHCGLNKVDFEPGSQLKRIGDHAFMGEDFSRVILPEGVEEIGEYAFCMCGNLKEITLPKSVRAIGKDCFLLCSDQELAIRCYKGSIAEKYAKNHGLRVKYIKSK